MGALAACAPLRAIRARRSIAALDGLVAVSAVAGAVALLAGASGMSEAYLDGTPFDSFALPALVLGLVVGGSALVAAILELRADRRAHDATILAGVMLGGWIVVQVFLLGFISWLQPVMFIIAAVQVALGVAARR